MKFFLLIFLYTFSVIPGAYAGGIGLGATRIIFNGAKNQTSLDVRNTSNNSSFLIQSWIENDKGEKSHDFIITPPLYVSKSNSENVLRIISNVQHLPKDRESLYWITVKAIPQEMNESKNNSLQFASANRIKLFYRPLGLSKKDYVLRASYINGNLKIENKSPYYNTVVNLKVGNKTFKPFMVSPFGSIEFKANGISGKNLSYQLINDYGAWSSPKKIHFE